MKKGTGIILALFAVIAALLAGLGIGIYLNGDKHEEKPSIKEDDATEKDLPLTSTVVKQLVKVVGIYTNRTISPYADYFYKRDKVILENEDISFRLSLAAETISDKFEEYRVGYDCNSGACGISYISEDELKDAYYSLFGASNKYERATFYLSTCTGIVGYKWNDKTNRFEALIFDGCGDSTCSSSESKAAYAKEYISNDSDKIEIYEYYMKVDCNSNENTYSVYSDYTAKNLIYTAKSYTDATIDNVLTGNKDKLGLYKYTFEIDKNDTYVFRSVEKVR